MTLELCEKRLRNILEPLGWGFCLTREKWNHSNGEQSDVCKVFIVPKQTAPKRIKEIDIVKSNWWDVYEEAVKAIGQTKQALAWGEAIPEEVEF